ncbi:MAG: hypothetical protein JJ863_13640 [Deltaproteobacteria bacterium]|nr:hypothetical protein [Deltaproteobacteria bacterium]
MSTQPYAEVDASELPFVVVHVVGPLTEEGYERYLGELLQAIQLRGRVGLRLHSGALHAFPPRYVRESVRWMQEHRDTLGRHVAGTALVMTSVALRMAAQAMVWAARPSFPFHVAASTAEANAWLRARLEGDPE